MNKGNFIKNKKAVLKKYPGAKTMCDWGGKFFVATAEGKDICNLQISQTVNKYKFNQTEGYDYGVDDFNSTLDKIPTIPHADDIDKAWEQAAIAIKSYHVVDRNNSKFSDEKIMYKALKDE